MAIDLSLIDTIVIVMMENRSFDHLLGYLSLPDWNRPVNGLRPDDAWRQQFVNSDGNQSFLPFNLQNPAQKLVGDPPHERSNIAIQLGIPQPGTLNYPMTGFVKSYSGAEQSSGQPIVMGYFADSQVPTSDFFAANYAICDAWFASLPASTQPNRLMAMSGSTLIDVNRSFELPEQPLVYDWLSNLGIRWRVYHDGLPFFAMMPKWIPTIMTGQHFRAYNRLRVDVKSEDDTTFPQVIFIEPRYTDAPHIEAPTDDHAPSPISSGQQFLMRIYNDLAANPDRWARMVTIITYDEHGGFFDHVNPPPIPTNPPPTATYQPFATLGVRVPAFVLSPFVSPGSVYRGTLDHLSILKFLGEKFNSGTYSQEVDDRPVNSVKATLDLEVPRNDIPFPDAAHVGFTPESVVLEPIRRAFAKAWEQIRNNHPNEAKTRFPDLTSAFQ